MSCPRCDQRPAAAPHPCPAMSDWDDDRFDCACCGSCARTCELAAGLIAEHSITVSTDEAEDGYTYWRFGA